MSKCCFTTSKWERTDYLFGKIGYLFGKIGNLKYLLCQCEWSKKRVDMLYWRPIVALAFMQTEIVCILPLFRTSSFQMYHSKQGLWKFEKWITYYLLKVKTRDEGKKRETEKKSRVAGLGYNLMLNANHTNWDQNQPMQSMFRIQRLHLVLEN